MKEAIWLVMLILCTNIVFGLALYWLPRWIFRFTGNDKSSLESNQSAKQLNTTAVRPKKEEALNLVPLQDAMVISDNKEKRRLLLGILKRNLEDNYEAAKSALEDDDSETTHYAAAAAMEIVRKTKLKVQKFEEEFKQKGDTETRWNLLDQLHQYITIGVLSGNELMIYVNKYLQLINETRNQCPEQLRKSDYIHELEILMERNHLHEAQVLAEQRVRMEPEEAVYLVLLEIYFRLHKQKEFKETLMKLQKSKVVLSAKGLDMLRFWMAREVT
ncbi:MAG: hypothetical protein K0R92_1891 [Lachnospiraceae bacterium]|jgi:outer membrane lipoprotein-sorting protein|nr:hypothetical protein [Lachnospiraceae bacterium]